MNPWLIEIAILIFVVSDTNIFPSYDFSTRVIPIIVQNGDQFYFPKIFCLSTIDFGKGSKDFSHIIQIFFFSNASSDSDLLLSVIIIWSTSAWWQSSISLGFQGTFIDDFCVQKKTEGWEHLDVPFCYTAFRRQFYLSQLIWDIHFIKYKFFLCISWWEN